jgi:hypothetical protein
MALKYFSAIISAAIAVTLYRHLVSGYVEWHEKAIHADRSKEPFSYWFIVSIEICFMALMIACVIVLPG